MMSLLDTSHFKALEALNIAIAKEARQGDAGSAFAIYDRLMASRESEVRQAIALARREIGKSHFIDGIEGALNRAVASPRGGYA